jgi:hypothetical protein
MRTGECLRLRTPQRRREPRCFAALRPEFRVRNRRPAARIDSFLRKPAAYGLFYPSTVQTSYPHPGCCWRPAALNDAFSLNPYGTFPTDTHATVVASWLVPFRRDPSNSIALREESGGNCLPVVGRYGFSVHEKLEFTATNNGRIDAKINRHRQLPDVMDVHVAGTPLQGRRIALMANCKPAYRALCVTNINECARNLPKKAIHQSTDRDSSLAVRNTAVWPACRWRPRQWRE